MRRAIAIGIASLTLLAASATSASADAGAPGTTFPAQPGSHLLGACGAVTTNPGSGFGGASETNESPTAGAITTGLLTSACF